MGVRIGCGAGCSSDRIEPAEDIIRHGELDYIIFECLAERTMADNVLLKEKDKSKGYTPMLRERMEKVLEPALENGVKIITNMGASNIERAVEVVKEVAREKNLTGFKIGAVYGDDIKDYVIEKELIEGKKSQRLISANVYTGIEGVLDLLKQDCDIIITGRIADASLFVAPIIHEYGWSPEDDRFAQATLLGHFLECAGQVTGGYAAEPGHKDIPDLWNLGFPISEIESDGSFIITKLEGTGGEVSERICKEQLAYEINYLENYITPDAIVNFSDITIDEIGENIVKITGAKVLGEPETLKASICFEGGFLGTGEVSYAGSNSFNKAKLCQEIIEKRLELTGVSCDEINFDLVGFSSLAKANQVKTEDELKETRLRMVVRDPDEDNCRLAVREMGFMYTNGPAGSSGLNTSVKNLIELDSILIPREDLELTTQVGEV